MPTSRAPSTLASPTPTDQVASHAERAARRSRSETEVLGERLGRLAPVTGALWSRLEVRADMTGDEMLEHVRAVDPRDGKVRWRASACPAWGRMVAQRHLNCN